MPHALIILGVFLALAGIGSIAAGAPSWALGLGLGSALIQSGAVGLVGGFLLVGIGFVLRALRDLSRRMDMIALGESAAPPARAPVAPPPPPARASAKREPGRREPPPFAGRETVREPALLNRPDEDDYPEAAERGRPPRSWPQEPDTRAPARPSPVSGRERTRPPLERAPLPERAPAYEDDYPEEPAPARNAPPGLSTTVVRSGIISGMAYTLYTDGSIEAELPIGTVRFSSIEELQDHVSQTGEDADVDFGSSHTPKI
jgi:hypothetical protein